MLAGVLNGAIQIGLVSSLCMIVGTVFFFSWFRSGFVFVFWWFLFWSSCVLAFVADVCLLLLGMSPVVSGAPWSIDEQYMDLLLPFEAR